MNPTPVWRPTARVLAVDPDGRLLLFSSANPDGSTWWFTPGGGVRRGETLTAAAVRELAEETGYACAEAALGPVVATCAGRWPAGHNGKVYFAADSFFFLRVPATDVDTNGQEDYERVVITGHRWFSVADMRRAAGTIFPVGLDDLVAALLRGAVPERPVRLPWTPDPPERAAQAARFLLLSRWAGGLRVPVVSDGAASCRRDMAGAGWRLRSRLAAAWRASVASGRRVGELPSAS